MHALIPLLLVFIALNGKQLRSDKLYRANVFAIVGICYFFFIQYIAYWNRVFPAEEWTEYLPGIVAVLGAVGFSLSPWNRKSHPVKTACLCSLFFISLAGTYVFDVKVKEWLAEKGGFFNDQISLNTNWEAATSAELFEFPGIGIEVRTSEGWRKAELPSGHEYLTYSDGDLGVMEVRPNCLGGMSIDTPTYVSNMLDLLEVTKPNIRYKYQCVKSERAKECLIRVEYPSVDGGRKRWHWLKSLGEEKSIAMDFIMPDGNKAFEEKALGLMATTRISDRRKTAMCNTPAAWL